jgi:hypothetical protein
MYPIDSESGAWFSKAIRLCNPAMGTESVGPLLYWLVRSSRAARILEVGAGYTTVLLAKALQDNLHDFEREHRALITKNKLYPPMSEAWSLAEPPLADPGYYLHPYQPRLLSIDSSSEENLKSIIDVLSSGELNQFVDFVSNDFRVEFQKLREAREEFDLIWFDCGGYDEYRTFIDQGWALINANGGYACLHFTLTNLSMGVVLRDLKLAQATGGLRDFELLSVLEPHKFSQNSYTILRKISGVRERIYYMSDTQMMSDVATFIAKNKLSIDEQN